MRQEPPPSLNTRLISVVPVPGRLPSLPAGARYLSGDLARSNPDVMDENGIKMKAQFGDNNEDVCVCVGGGSEAQTGPVSLTVDAEAGKHVRDRERKTKESKMDAVSRARVLSRPLRGASLSALS